MTPRLKARQLVLFLWLSFLSGGTGLFFSSLCRLKDLRMTAHHFSLSLPFFFLGFILSFFLFFLMKKGIHKLEEKRLHQPPVSTSPFNLFPSTLLWPFLLYYLTPLLHRYYLDKEDFQTRLLSLGGLPFVFLIVFLLARGSFTSDLFPWLRKISSSFTRLEQRRKLVILFLAALLIYNLVAFGLVEKGLSFSGDEPYYLLNTHSLLHDRDINLANNYAHQDYFHFYSREENPNFRLGIYARQGKKGPDYLYPINLFGVSILILPQYWLSHFFQGKWLVFILKSSLSLWAALLGVQLYLLLLEIWRKEKIALTVWGLSSLSAPILFYAVHIYPEIPIALFSTFLYRRLRSGHFNSRTRFLGYGFLLGLFPWFGLKYNIIFWAFFLLFLYHLYQHRKKVERFSWAAFSLPPLASMIGFYLFVYSLYGSFSPFSVYEGVLTPEKFRALKTALLDYPLRMRIDSFLDYFLDQRDGLFLYAPFYFFSLLGLVEAWRHKRSELFQLLFIALPFLLNYAFFTHRQGYSPQGRVLTPLIWIGCLLTGYFLAYNRRQNYRLLFWFSGGLSLVLTLILLSHPRFLYQPTTHEFTSRAGDLFVYLSNIKIFLPGYLPSFIKINNLSYWPNYFWLAGLIIFVLLAFVNFPRFFSKRKWWSPSFPAGMTILFLASSTLLFALYPQPALYPSREFHFSNQSSLGFYFYSLQQDVVAKKEAEFYLHAPRKYTFLFASRKKLEKLRLRFGSEVGEYQIQLNFFDQPLFHGGLKKKIDEIYLSPQASFFWKNFHLYEIKLNLTHLSSEPMKRYPFLIQIYPLRE